MFGNIPIKPDSIIAGIFSIGAVAFTVWKDMKIRRDVRETEERRTKEDKTKKEYDERQVHLITIAEMVRSSYEHMNEGQIKNNESLLHQLEWYVTRVNSLQHELDVCKIIISTCSCGCSKRLIDLTSGTKETNG